MTLSIRASGSWRQLRKVFVRSEGSWRDCKSVWVRKSGIWKQVFSAIEPILTGANFTAAWIGSAGSTSIHFSPDGRVEATGGELGRWVDSPGREQFYIRLMEDAGPAPVLGVVGSWIPLTADQSWMMEAAGRGKIKQQSLTYSISKDQNVPLVSGLLTFINDNS